MNTRDYLETREAELVTEIVRLQGALMPLESELADVRRAMAALGVPRAPVQMPDIASLTMKQLVTKALSEHFPEGGARTRQLIDFFSDVWGRDIERPNLSPQLSRLRQDGIIDRDPKTQRWRLAMRPRLVA